MPRDHIYSIAQAIGEIAKSAIIDIPDIVIGTVISSDPLRVQLGEGGAEIEQKFIIPSPFVLGKRLSITVDDDTQTGEIWRGISTGDRLLMLRSADSQKFAALWRTDGANDYNDTVSWALSSTNSVEGSTTVFGSNIVQVARGELGVAEVGSSNKVKYNTWYYGKAVQGTAYPWCAVFVSWCANACGISTAVVPRSASVLVFENFYAQRGRRYNYGSYTPVPGDFYSTPQNGHIGIVEQVLSSTSWYGIEGNYSNRVSRVLRSGGLRYVMSPIYPN